MKAGNGRCRIETFLCAFGVVVASLAFGAPLASADSIVYIKDNDVWLAEPDGTGQTQVTDDGTASDPYYSPSQANDGTILALKGDDINAQFHRLNQAGRLLVPPFDHAAPAYPQSVAVSPNGELLAYHIKAISGGSVVDRTYFSYADEFTDSEEITSSVNFEHPAWMSNSRVFLSFGAAQTYTYDIGDADAETWFAESDVQVRQPDVTAANDRIVVVAGEGALLEFFQTNGAPPAAPARATCVINNPKDEFNSPTWAPNGTELAWQEGGSGGEAGDGIWYGRLDSGLTPSDCANFLSAALIIPRGSEPDWGPADIDAGGGGDTTPPQTSIDSGPGEGSTISDTTPEFSFSSSEGGSSFECKVDGASFSSCSSPRQIGPLADGQHTFSVRATDAVGNTDASPATRTFTVDTGGGGDTDPPETTILAGPAKDTIRLKKGKRRAKVVYDYGSDENPVTFQCNINSSGWQNCFPSTLYTLPKGKWTLEARAVDAAGNVDPTPVSDTITVKKKKK